MTLPTLILTIGIPGSGKSTWAKKYVESRSGTVLISTDELRKELTGIEQCNPVQSDWIHDETRKRVQELMMNPDVIEIVVDATNTDKEEWKKYKEMRPILFIAKFFPISVDEAMKRQENRERKVPREILEMKQKELEKNLPTLPYIFDLLL